MPVFKLKMTSLDSQFRTAGDQLMNVHPKGCDSE